MADPTAGPTGLPPTPPSSHSGFDQTASFPADQSAVHDGDANLASPQQPDELGRLAGYRVLRVLGRGGMGAVYAAEDIRLRRPVALKVMKPDIAKRPGAAERFVREAQAAAGIKDDHVVTIYQADEDRGTPYIAMEFLQGKPVDEWMRETPPSSAQVLKIGYETALGLAAAHAKGLIHRDIKPANLWLEAPHGRVKILDFGLARLTDDDVQLTGSGVVVGTPAYMAPEQARGRAVDHRTDLFSLGCVLYHLATGQRPFTGPDTMAILSSLALDTPTPPYELNPELPPALSALILKLLEKDPAARPASAKAVAAELKAINAELSQPAPVAVSMSMPVMVAPEAKPTVWEDIDVSQSVVQAIDGPVVKVKKPAKGGFPKVLAASLLFAGLTTVVAAGVLWKVLWPDLPAAATTEPPSPPTKASEPVLVPIDVLARVDPTLDAIRGTWERRGNELVGLGDGKTLATLALPYRPPAEYDYIVEFTRTDGDSGLGLTLSRSPAAFEWCLAAGVDGDRFGFNSVSGRDFFADPELKRPDRKLVNGRRYTAKVEVRSSGATAYLDGQRISVLPTDYTNLTLSSVAALRDPSALGVSLSHIGVVFHRIEVVEVTGKGTFTRPNAAPDPTFFNGKDLTGWEGYTKAWKADGGTLVGTAVVSGQFMTTNRDYADFELAFRFAQLDATALSMRVAFRCPPLGVASGYYAKSPQVNLSQSEKTAGVTVRRDNRDVPVASKLVVKPDGLNDVLIRCVGQRAKVVVNGEIVIDQELDMPSTGRIGFFPGQQGRVELRDIRFTNLSPPTDSTFFNGKDLTTWKPFGGNWRVETGELVGTPTAPDTFQTLYWTGTARDFELSFEARGLGDTPAVCFRSWNHAQAGVKLGKRHGWLTAQDRDIKFINLAHPTAAATAAVKEGEYNTYTLRVVGQRVGVTVNGVVASDAEYAVLEPEGTIGWTLGPGSTELRVRNIRLTPLDPPTDPTFFNGKDLTGWTGNPDHWKVVDGTLVGKSPGHPRSFLYSTREYTDFDLSFEAKVAGLTNSGVQFRSRVLGPANSLLYGPQCDLVAKNWGGVWGEQFAGGNGPGVPRQLASPAFAMDGAGRFVPVRVRVVGKRVTITADGKQTVDREFDMPAAGVIGWQLHLPADAPAGTAEATFRNVRFTDLSLPTDPTFFNGTDLVGWIGDPNVWKVKDRAIVGGRAAGREPSFLRTRKPYRDFEMAFDCQVNYDGTSYPVLRFRASDKNLLAGLGLQFKTDGIAFAGPRLNGTSSAPLKADESVPVTVKAVGRRVTVSVRNKVLVDDEFDVADEGVFAWGVVPASAQISVRNLRFTNLTPPMVEADPNAAVRERKAAESLLPHTRVLQVRLPSGEDRQITSGEKLPDGPFSVVGLHLLGGRPAADFVPTVLLPATANFPELKLISQDFDGATPYTPDDLAALARQPCAAQLHTLNSAALPLTPRSLDALKAFPKLSGLICNAATADDAVVARLPELSTLTNLGLIQIGDSGRVTPRGMDVFAELKLTKLALWNWKKDPVGGHFGGVARMATLQELDLNNGTFGDDVPAALAASTSLKSLFIPSSKMTDAGLDHLVKLTSLRTLGVLNTKVTRVGVTKLAAARPDLRIIWDGGTIEPDPKAAADRERKLAEWVLSLGGSVGWPNPKGGPFVIIEPGQPLPAGPISITSINAKQAKFGNADLARIADAPNVGMLVLSNTDVTDDGLTQVGKLPRLTKLYLSGLPITDDGLTQLKGVPLTLLHLADTKVSGRAVPTLLGFSDLRELNLDKCAIGDADVEKLAALPKLVRLMVPRTKVTEAGLRKFAAARSRCTIYWNGPTIEPTDTDARAAEKLRPLVGAVRVRVKATGRVANVPPGEPLPDEPFWLIGVVIDKPMPADFATKTLLPAVAGAERFAEILDPEFHLTVTAADLAKLADLPCAKEFGHLDTGLTLIPQTLDTLKKFPKLSTLKCWGTATDEALLGRLKELPPLKELGLRKLGAADEIGISNGLGKLVVLRVKRIGLRESVIGEPKLLGFAAGNPNLEAIDLSDTPVGNGLFILSQTKTLAELKLDRTQTTDTGLTRLAGVATLRKLSVRGTKVTAAGVKKLAAARPECRIEWDGGVIEPTKK